MGHVSVLALENGEHFSFCPTKKIKKFWMVAYLTLVTSALKYSAQPQQHCALFVSKTSPELLWRLQFKFFFYILLNRISQNSWCY
jgi:hypothetical protein